MKKRLLLTFAIFSFLLTFSYAQELPPAESPSEETEGFIDGDPGNVEDEIINIKGQEFAQAETFTEFIHSLDFCFDIGPAMYINTKSKAVNADGYLISGPSPVVEPVTIGILWPNYTFVSVEPTVSYFSMYYLWYDGTALPAEIENRTVNALSFMFNVPVVFQLYLKNMRFQISGGIGVLARFGLLAGGVKESDSGYTGTAGGDLKEMNNWFWKDARFMYISTGFSCLFNMYGKVKAGPTIKAYIPMSLVTTKQGLQGMIIDAGLKISL